MFMSTYSHKRNIVNSVNKRNLLVRIREGDDICGTYNWSNPQFINVVLAPAASDLLDPSSYGWDEFETYEYSGDGTKRVPYVEAAAAAKSITNAANVGVFDILGAGTVKGIFLCGQPVGGGASPADQGDHHADGILWSTIFFTTGNAAVLNGDQLKITYTVST